MYQWQKQIQIVVDEIDKCITNHDDEALTLRILSQKLGYSEFYMTRKFKEISGMQFRDYLRQRKLAFALKEMRDNERNILDIALDRRLPGLSKGPTVLRRANTEKGLSPSSCVQRSTHSTAIF